MNNTVFIPADVPQGQHQEFVANYNAITCNSGKLLMLAGDQKLEHLNANYYGPGIHPDANHPEHLFAIASSGGVTAFATHLGLIARYGAQYNEVNYIVKLNGKTNITPKELRDPLSHQLWSVADALTFKQRSGLNIRGIGYTVFLGGEHEAVMLHEAAQAVFHAHAHGLVAILWMYPRATHIKDERSFDLVTGAAGIAASLGADFAKINPPTASSLEQQVAFLRIAVAAAGNTKLVCSGGERIQDQEFLQHIYSYLHDGGICGAAIGRNIYQRSRAEAIAYSHILQDIIIKGKKLN